MSSNPFLNAINFQPPTQGAQSFDRQSYINNMLSNMHGVDMSQLPQNTWQPDDSFINAMSNYSKSGASGSPSIPGALSNAQAPQGSGSSSGLSFIDRLKNAVGDAWNQTIGKEYSQAKGGLEGMLTGPLSVINVKQGTVQAPKNILDPITGYFNPQQEAQKYQATKDAMGKGVVPWALGTAADTVTDPLTYAPVGPALKALKVPAALSGIAKAVGKGTGAVYDAALPLLGKVGSKAPSSTEVGQAFKGLFQVLPGTRDTFKQAYANMFNTRASQANAISKSLQDIFKGVPASTRVALTHAMESTPTGTTLNDPALESLRQKVEPLLQKAFETAKSKGLIDGGLDTSAMNVGRYIPHIVAGKLDTEGAPIYAKFGSMMRPAFDAAKDRAKAGTIADINKEVMANPSAYQNLFEHYGMNPSDKLFEDDMLKILGSHLHQLNNATTARDFIASALANGEKVPSDYLIPKGKLHPDTNTPVGSFSHEGEQHLLPKAEADVLNGIGKDTTSLGSKVYKVGVNALNKAMFASKPWLHIVNNLGWQSAVHDPRIITGMFEHLPEAFKGVQPGSTMDNALKSGALHLSSEIGTRGSVADRVAELVNSVDNPKNPVLNAINQGYFRLSPNVEKAYRTSAFERATNRGMSPQDASEWVRSKFGGHAAPGMVSKAEQGATLAMPFFNWTKTAMKSNAENALQRPAPYVAAFNAMNDMNQQTTGHGILQNHNPLTVGLPETNAQGLQTFYEPYLPALDVGKYAKSVTSEGPLRGTLDFSFSRQNPIAKIVAQVLSDNQNPYGSSSSKYPVVPYEGNPLVPPQAHDRGVLFGDKGWQTNPWLAQAIQDTPNPLSSFAGLFNQSPVDNLLTTLLSGYASNPNPVSNQKSQAYDMRTWQSQLKSYEKKTALGKSGGR